MKLYTALPFLAGFALAAPQQQHAARDTKPFKEIPTNFANCYERDDAPTLQARPPILSEECTGTMAYCFRQYYKNNGEEFASTDECLLSRGIDPKTVDAQRILNKDDYSAGVQALHEGNAIYNRYMLIMQLRDTYVAREHDREGSDLIDRLARDNEYRVSLARESLDTAKWRFGRAFSPEFAEEINQAIQEARGKLNAAWVEAKKADVNQIANLRDWISGKTEEKYAGPF